MKACSPKGYDASSSAAARRAGATSTLPGRKEAAANIHIGIDWLASVSFGHITSVGKRVIVLGGGNTAMDCCRSARRLGGDDVKVIVRSGFEEMKASPWEKEDAMHEGIPILNYHVPKAFEHEGGKLTGMTLRDRAGGLRRQGPAQPGAHRRARRDCSSATRCWSPSARRTPSPGSSATSASSSTSGACPSSTRDLQSTVPAVFFGGDAAFGPKNIITAVAHGHEAAVSIDRFLHGEDVTERPPPHVNLVSQKMGIHEWSYDNAPATTRHKVPWAAAETALASIKVEVELGFDPPPPSRKRSAA
jgi:formate dehydrogenase beta subunit